MATHFQPLKIREVRRETASTVSIAFDVPEHLREDFSYEAGQYLTLRTVLNGEELRRSYSLCSSPGQEDFRVAVKEVEGGKFSTWANRSLAAGVDIEAMPPAGNFKASGRAGHHIAFAAGSGITPCISILRAVLEADAINSFTLFYGNKTFDEIIFREELAQLEESYGGRLNVIHVLSQEQRAGIGFGRMDAARLDSSIHQGVLNVDSIASAYLCGPAEMIFSLQNKLTTLGLDQESILFELFTAPVSDNLASDTSEEKTNAPAVGGGTSTTYVLDGIRTEIDGCDPDETILDIGLAQGIDLPFACQGGVCCTCRAKIISGKVDMRQNFSLGDSEVEEGYVLTCQSYPVGQDTVVDYDS